MPALDRVRLSQVIGRGIRRRLVTATWRSTSVNPGVADRCMALLRRTCLVNLVLLSYSNDSPARCRLDTA
jgi:hypothetical protein